jgi:phosphopantothenoylcysteine decarboxylase/phosphopantothenate--cysteine ligase
VGYSLKNKKILITCGPTWVPIDAVRVVSNVSSGELGQRIALDCVNAGAHVTLLEGPVARPLTSRSIRILKFCFFDELQRLLKQELRKNVDVVIHAAAVADYKLKVPVRHKLSSEKKTLRLEFIATPKLIRIIKRVQPKTFLAGFKLESNITRESAHHKAKNLFRVADCDVVVVNELTARGYKGFILDKHNTISASAADRKRMSKALVRILSERL